MKVKITFTVNFNEEAFEESKDEDNENDALTELKGIISIMFDESDYIWWADNEIKYELVGD